MDSEIARNAMILLARVDIKGGEAPVLMQIMQALQQIVDARVTDSPPMKLVRGE
jgi:hypothetical protein